jgi:hypothetical protein
MLVFMVGSPGGLALLSGDHARFVPLPQRGQKNPARGGAVTEDGRPQLLNARKFFVKSVASLTVCLAFHCGRLAASP